MLNYIDLRCYNRGRYKLGHFQHCALKCWLSGLYLCLQGHQDGDISGEI